MALGERGVASRVRGVAAMGKGVEPCRKTTWLRLCRSASPESVTLISRFLFLSFSFSFTAFRETGDGRSQ